MGVLSFNIRACVRGCGVSCSARNVYIPIWASSFVFSYMTLISNEQSLKSHEEHGNFLSMVLESVRRLLL